MARAEALLPPSAPWGLRKPKRESLPRRASIAPSGLRVRAYVDIPPVAVEPRRSSTRLQIADTSIGGLVEVRV